jgi:hypothetical protein
MIRCPRCDAPSRIEAQDPDEKRRVVDVLRVCAAGHLFETKEVHATMVADSREMRSARQNIDRRVALWRRDLTIVASAQTDKELAEVHGITPTRVRQIRAAVREFHDAPAQRKIRSSTQKGQS